MQMQKVWVRRAVRLAFALPMATAIFVVMAYFAISQFGLLNPLSIGSLIVTIAVAAYAIKDAVDLTERCSIRSP